MSRFLVRAAAVLVLGAASSLAVALGLAAWRPIPMYPRTHGAVFLAGERGWGTAEVRRFGIVDRWWDDLAANEPVRSPRDFLAAVQRRADPAALVAEGRKRLEDTARQQPGFVALEGPPRWGTFAPGSRRLPGEEHTMGSDTAFGWPRPCLWYRVVSTFSPVTMSITSDRLEGGVHLRGGGGAVSSRARSFRALPLWPIWSGLVVNALVFAGVWAVPVFGAPAARRALRRRRGRCAACGYSLEGLVEGAGGKCPECGAGVLRPRWK